MNSHFPSYKRLDHITAESVLGSEAKGMMVGPGPWEPTVCWGQQAEDEVFQLW